VRAIPLTELLPLAPGSTLRVDVQGYRDQQLVAAARQTIAMPGPAATAGPSPA
jgi:hypothetical protein